MARIDLPRKSNQSQNMETVIHSSKIDEGSSSSPKFYKGGVENTSKILSMITYGRIAVSETLKRILRRD